MKRNMEPTHQKTFTVEDREMQAWIDAIYIVSIQSLQHPDSATTRSLNALATVLEMNRQMTQTWFRDDAHSD